jgi:hypothetical protein
MREVEQVQKQVAAKEKEIAYLKEQCADLQSLTRQNDNL